MDKTKNYKIVDNLESHEGYKGEEVKIIVDYETGYCLVEAVNNRQKQWFCGEKELKEV
jgi:hypothetical protein